MSFYEARYSLHKNDELKQGDIVSPVPFTRFSMKEVPVLAPDAAEPIITNLAQTPIKDGSKLLVNVMGASAIVVNQSCDLSSQPGREKFIKVARVVPCVERIKGFKPDNVKEVVNQIKNLTNPGKNPNLFYLPEYEDADFNMPKSVADLLDTMCFLPYDLAALAPLVKLRLTPTALQAFQEKLAYSFGRFGVPDGFFFNKEEWQYETEQRSTKQNRKQ